MAGQTPGSDELWMLNDVGLGADRRGDGLLGYSGAIVRASFASALEQAFASGKPAVVDVKTHIDGIAPPPWAPE